MNDQRERWALPAGPIDTDDLAGLVRSVREDMGMSQESFGQHYFGVSGATVQDWENGRSLDRIRVWMTGWKALGYEMRQGRRTISETPLT